MSDCRTKEFEVDITDDFKRECCLDCNEDYKEECCSDSKEECCADCEQECFSDCKDERCACCEDSYCEPPELNLSPKELGEKGERAAVMFLERKGWEILDMNWCCFAGEADIVALDEDTLCFIEVKTRSGANKGFPEEAVDAKKRDRYEKIAACYLQNCNLNYSHVRFDIISIIVLSPARAFLRLHTNAFGEGM